MANVPEQAGRGGGLPSCPWREVGAARGGRSAKRAVANPQPGAPGPKRSATTHSAARGPEQGLPGQSRGPPQLQTR